MYIELHDAPLDSAIVMLTRKKRVRLILLSPIFHRPEQEDLDLLG